MRHRSVLLILLAIAGVGLFLALSKGFLTLDRPQRIAYLRCKGKRCGLYLMDGQKKKLASFTGPTLGFASPPTWSPDGRRIAYVTHESGDFQIYIIRTDGRGGEMLARSATLPSWSPDSQRIIYVGDTYKGEQSIFVAHLDGEDAERLVRDATYPLWSPDGEWIAYILDPGGESDIYLMDPEGKVQRRLTEGPEKESLPVWSPDGNQIAYLRRESSGQLELRVVKADGSQDKSLSVLGTYYLLSSPAWSPDGSRIAYVGAREGNLDIYIVEVENKREQRLTSAEGLDILPSWSPDGKRVLFTSYRHGNGDLFTIEVDGENETRLTSSEDDEGYGSWSP
ncbi:MAG: DPP IV N-terminal domain-containing protein [Anaerolineae bacterium]